MEQNRFEKLKVWEKAHKLTLQVYQVTKDFPKDEVFSLVNQLRRAVSSVPANIVEGNEKKTKKEFIQFLYTAKGSLAEVKYFLILARDLKYLKNDVCQNLIEEINEIGKMINGLITYLRSKIFDLRSKSAFTFIELMVVMAIVAILVLIGIAILNPLGQIGKSWDSRRKAEFSSLSRVIEDWYNDKGSYPKPSEICFDAASSSRIDNYGKTACTCHMCGNNKQSPSFSPYLAALPCDPQSPALEYLYDFDCSGSSPNWFRAYTKLSITTDPAIRAIGCQHGCGPAPKYAYNYGISSGTDLERDIASCGNNKLYQKDSRGNCNICNNRSDPDVCNHSQDIFIDVACTKPCL